MGGSERGQALHLLSGKEGIVFGTPDDFVDVLQIGEPKQFITSDRRKGQRLEVKLFDDSIAAFPLIWCVMLVY